MRRRFSGRFFVVATLIALAWTQAAVALDIRPFDTTNRSPLVQIYGLPSIGGGRVMGRSHTSVGLTLDLASNFTKDRNTVEELVFDGETHRTTLSIRHGIAANLELGLDLPYVSHSGGFLDGFIIDWHDAFGLPQGGRDSASHDVLEYRYSRDGVDLISLTQDTAGTGDVRLSGALQLSGYQHADRALALRASVKLPTGDSGRLLGSGAADAALWLSTETQHRERRHPWGWFGGAGLLWLGNGDILPEQQRNLVYFGNVGIGWSPWPRLALKVQIDAHSPFYRDSQLEQLNDYALQMAMGGAVALSDRTSLELAVLEDLSVNASPDVVFHLSLHSRY